MAFLWKGSKERLEFVEFLENFVESKKWKRGTKVIEEDFINEIIKTKEFKKFYGHEKKNLSFKLLIVKIREKVKWLNYNLKGTDTINIEDIDSTETENSETENFEDELRNKKSEDLEEIVVNVKKKKIEDLNERIIGLQKEKHLIDLEIQTIQEELKVMKYNFYRNWSIKRNDEYFYFFNDGIILRPEDITFILDTKKPPIGWVFKKGLFYNTENEEQNVDIETCAFLKAEFPFIFQ